MDIQKLFDAISEASRNTRKDYHLTLGELIDVLDAAPPDAVVTFSGGGGIGRERSYRGYYHDLALEPAAEAGTAADLAKRMKAAAGSTYEGYKGGDYTMNLDTPLWRAYYGCCGDAIIDAQAGDGTITLVTKMV